jgi:hypothetical protein
MAGSLPARLSAREGRKFGLTVGIAFLVLGALAYWRAGLVLGAVFGSLGVLLLGGGLLLPTRLGPVQRAWMGLAHAISKVTTPIIMGVIYFLILTPAGLLRRTIGDNQLVRKPGSGGLVSGGFWIEREPGHRKSDLARQY